MKIKHTFGNTCAMCCGFVFNNPLKQASENENRRCEKPALCVCVHERAK